MIAIPFKSIGQTIRSSIKSWTIYYYLVAFLAVVYILIILSPVFRFFFVQDDLVMFDLGASLKGHPSAFIFFTYCGWWRPIGFTGAAWLYQFFGLNPFPYHVAGFLLHLFTAITLVLLTRRLFNLRAGLLASVFYITSTTGVNSIGFVSNAFQDELGAAFIMLAMLVSIRMSGDMAKRHGPYLGATLFLFLSAGCKESWIAYIPVAIYLDFMNYHKSSFRQRILRLAPLTLVFSMFYFRYEFGGDLSFQGPLNYFTHTFGLDNLLWGATLPFLPFGVPYDKFLANNLSDWLRMIAPISLFALAWIIKKQQRDRIILLVIIFTCFLIVLAGALLNNGFWGWCHMPVLIAISSIVMAIILEKIIPLTFAKWAPLVLLFILVGYNYLQFFTIIDNVNDLKIGTRAEMIQIRSFQSTASNLVPGDVLVSFGGPTNSLAIDALIPKGVEYIRVFRKGSTREMNKSLASPMDYVRRELGSRALSPKTHYIGQVDGVFQDYTGQVKAKLAAEMAEEQQDQTTD